MAEIRIINGKNSKLEAKLGILAKKLEIVRGDTIVKLNTQEECAVGRAVFEKLITEGWVAFSVGETGKTEKQLFEFDPDAQKTVMFGPIAGG